MASNLPINYILSTWALLCFFLRHSFELQIAALTQSSTSSGHAWLDLSLGQLNIINFAGALQASRNLSIYTVDNNLFFPVLSSPSFTNSNNASQSLGFSFGFLLVSSNHFYLAVCGGVSGDQSSPASSFDYEGLGILDGYVTPVWLANPNKPMISMNFSLGVVDVGGSNQLQLQDGERTIIWSVENAGILEMQDTGDLLVYDSENKPNVIWQSSTQPTSTLFQGKRLSVGMELTSNDSSYSARMESGALVFYLNTAKFVEYPSPYWVFPIVFRNFSREDNHYYYSPNNSKDYVFSSPCATSPNSAYIMLAKSSVELFFEPGNCQSEKTSILFDSQIVPDWSFVRLENDGRLYAYAVVRNRVITNNFSISNFATQSYAVDSWASNYRVSSSSYRMNMWKFLSCDVPMRCGSLGVCKPFATDTCACPPSFHQVNSLDSSKGCKRARSLPQCKRGNEHISATTFLQLDNMATIFLFSGWSFPTTSANVDSCKQSCTLNCSCNGFFYQADKNACFFITDEITLLSLNDSSSNMNVTTYLKVALGEGKSSTPRPKFLIFFLATCVPALVIAFLVIGFCLLNAAKRKRNRMNKQVEDDGELRDILPLVPSRFSYKDLHQATNGFKKELGAGAFSSVYAGVLLDGRKVAVKILASALEGQAKQFLAEIATIGHTNHVNVVSLIGYCCEVSHRLLVYEYVERGSLDKWLFSKKGFLAEDTQTTAASASVLLLDWQTRYNVALGIARGLSYLHEDCIQPILHFDIKPQNILLDSEFTAKLGDFGMSRLMKRGSSQLATVEVKGTPGYIAPEWLSRGVVGKKCDVYSMGMVMLEIVGGKRNAELTLSKSALDSMQPEAWHFSSWVRKNCEEGSMMELVDERLKMSMFNMEQVETLIYTALWCIQENPRLRPSAFEVVQWLERRCAVKRPPFVVHRAQASDS